MQHTPSPICGKRISARGAVLLALLAVVATAPSSAGDGKLVFDDKNPISASSWSICDFVGKNTLYEGDGFIQKVRFRARYQGQFVDTNDDYVGGGEAEFWEHRRWRSGIDLDMANDLKLVSSFNHDTSPNFNGERFVDSLYEMKLSWTPSDDFYVVVGKQKQRITREWSTSSASILTFERSTLVNNVLSLPLWGTAVGFSAGGLMHEVGVHAVGYDNDFAWPDFDGGVSFTYRTNYAVCESTTMFFDYQYVDTDAGSLPASHFNASPYENVFALGTESEWGRLGLVTDLIFALDRRDRTLDDTWGFVIMPYYDITDKLQFVAKYSYAEDVRTDRPQRHASRPLVDGLSTLYAGLTYRICGDNLKLMAGYEYATGDRIVNTTTDYRNNSWLVGIRTNW